MKLSIIACLLFTFVSTGQSPILKLVETPEGSNHMIVTRQDSTYDIRTTGKDPYVFSKPLKEKLSIENSQLSFEYFCPTGLDFIELMFYSNNEIKSTKMIQDIGSTEGFVAFKVEVADALKDWGAKGDILRIDLGAAPNLVIQIKNIQFRPLTTREKELLALKNEKKAQEEILENHLRDYLNADFENAISNVLVRHDNIVVTGRAKRNERLFLAEIPVYQNLTELKDFIYIEPIESQTENFQISLNRTIKRNGLNEDRIFSKWVIMKEIAEGYSITSHARYADSVVPKYKYSYVKPTTKKGLGGYRSDREAPSSDLDELGITSVTVNIWINGIFRAEASEENLSFTYLGNTYYVNKKELEKYDATMIAASERNIEVSAILLVAKETESTDKEIGRILQHPDTDPSGIYAMPDVTSQKGVQYYSAILDFLAERYSRPDKKYGRLHNWIIHNEVDAGWVWTNAGEKEPLVFMDLYHKSMRISHYIAHKYNPNSKVFISLTHYWNWTSNPRFYHSKELLEMLLKFSHKEGNFEWAVAHHPYPEDLREPKTWLDKKVTFDFDTQLITFKNIEVLDAWVKQPEVLFKGKKRTVYLSENGTNSPTYAEKDLNEQAAGMAYALKKIKFLDGIDGFQYHNWQDNRKEGGLRIGLRRFADDKEAPGAKKPVWNVYEAYGTDREDEVFDKYKKVIGIDNWNEIRYQLPVPKKKVKK